MMRQVGKVSLPVADGLVNQYIANIRNITLAFWGDFGPRADEQRWLSSQCLIGLNTISRKQAGSPGVADMSIYKNETEKLRLFVL